MSPIAIIHKPAIGKLLLFIYSFQLRCAFRATTTPSQPRPLGTWHWVDTHQTRQMYASNFAPGSTSWWVTFSIRPISHALYGQARRHSQNRKYIRYWIVVLHCRQMRTDNTNKKFHEVWTCGRWDMLADRQTDIQTRSLQYFTPYRRRSNNQVNYRNSHNVALVLIYSFQFRSFPLCSRNWFPISQSFTFSRKETFSSRDLELWPMTLTYKHDLDRVKINRISIGNIYRSQVISFESYRPNTRTHAHSRLTALPGP